MNEEKAEKEKGNEARFSTWKVFVKCSWRETKNVEQREFNELFKDKIFIVSVFSLPLNKHGMFVDESKQQRNRNLFTCSLVQGDFLISKKVRANNLRYINFWVIIMKPWW